MGYSSTAMAAFAWDAMVTLLKESHGQNPSTNAWGPTEQCYFVERGRENPDGAMTGTVLGPHPKGPQYSRRVGSVRVEADGTVTRWPTATAKQRKFAFQTARAKFDARYGSRPSSFLKP